MKVRDLEIDNGDPQNQEHRLLAIPPLEKDIVHPGTHPWLKRGTYLVIGFGLLFLMNIVLAMLMPDLGSIVNKGATELLKSPQFAIAVGVGFVAQVIDGALGMAYGITSTTFLLASGFTPAAASAAVHVAEVFTTGFSGAAHLRLNNVDKNLFKRLLIPGIIGGILGAYVVTSIDAKILKPIISVYLLFMGFYILSKAWKVIKQRQHHDIKHVGKLALVGGFVDSAGGGGWGPVVTTTLLAHGTNPRMTIGSVNAAEFFIALSTAISFVILTELSHWQLIVGLIVGGLFAAPFAAWLCRHLKARTLLIIVGFLISGLSIYNLVKLFLS